MKQMIDEPVVLQIKDTLELPWPEDVFLELKLGCDELSVGYGEFGSITNPIPVNGAVGEAFYLNRLLTKDGDSVTYHRLGSRLGVVLETLVDEYAVQTADGQVKLLYFDMYNLWRTTNVPMGFTLRSVSGMSDNQIELLKVMNPETYT